MPLDAGDSMCGTLYPLPFPDYLLPTYRHGMIVCRHSASWSSLGLLRGNLSEHRSCMLLFASISDGMGVRNRFVLHDLARDSPGTRRLCRFG